MCPRKIHEHNRFFISLLTLPAQIALSYVYTMASSTTNNLAPYITSDPVSPPAVNPTIGTVVQFTSMVVEVTEFTCKYYCVQLTFSTIPPTSCATRSTLHNAHLSSTHIARRVGCAHTTATTLSKENLGESKSHDRAWTCYLSTR